MKKLTIAICTLILCSTGLAWGYNAWGFYVGYWDTKDADDGVGPGLKLSIEMVPSAQLELRATYFDDLGGDADVEAVPLEAGLVMTHAASDEMDIYGGVGLGYYMLDADTGNPDDELGFYFVGGLDWNIGEMSALFAEVLYRDVDTDVGPTDVDLSGVGVNGGLLIKW